MISAAKSTNYVFERYRIDARKRLLFRGDAEQIALKPKAFDTLLYLVSHAGVLVEKDQLMSAVWPDTVVEENNLNKNISALRHVFGEGPGEHRFIVTVPGRGYKFVAPVSELSENGISTEGLSTESHPPASSPVTLTGDHPASRFWLVAILITAVAGLSLVGFYSARETDPAGPINSIAVLPFTNVSGDAEMDYLSEGLSENLLDRLSELPNLKVIARSSSFKYRGDDLDLQDVANKLGVQAIVTGRLARRGDELRIRIELVNAADNKQLWGGEFNLKFDDALEFEGEIARTISNKLNLTLTGSQSKHLVEKGTDDPNAYELMLKGDFLDRKGGLENITKAVEHYKRAIAIDPNYGRAYARLAHAYDHLAHDSLLDPKVAYPEARAAAQKAVELDASLPDTHLQLASLARSSWDWTTAESEYMRALELNPSFAEARHRYSSLLSILGKHDDAIEQARLAKELDPKTLARHFALPNALSSARRYGEMLNETKKIMELDGNSIGANFFHGIALAENGMFPEALSAFKEAAIRNKIRAPYLQIFLGSAYAWVGDRKSAQAILRSLENDKEYVSPGELAILYVALGDHEKAFAALEKAFSTRDLQLQFLKTPEFDPLRADPRFHDLVRRVGLPEG